VDARFLATAFATVADTESHPRGQREAGRMRQYCRTGNGKLRFPLPLFYVGHVAPLALIMWPNMINSIRGYVPIWCNLQSAFDGKNMEFGSKMKHTWCCSGLLKSFGNNLMSHMSWKLNLLPASKRIFWTFRRSDLCRLVVLAMLCRYCHVRKSNAVSAILTAAISAWSLQWILEKWFIDTQKNGS